MPLSLSILSKKRLVFISILGLWLQRDDYNNFCQAITQTSSPSCLYLFQVQKRVNCATWATSSSRETHTWQLIKSLFLVLKALSNDNTHSLKRHDCCCLFIPPKWFLEGLTSDDVVVVSRKYQFNQLISNPFERISTAALLIRFPASIRYPLVTYSISERNVWIDYDYYYLNEVNSFSLSSSLPVHQLPNDITHIGI